MFGRLREWLSNRRGTPPASTPAPIETPADTLPALSVSKSADGKRLIVSMHHERVEVDPAFALYFADLALDIIIENLDDVQMAYAFYDTAPPPLNSMEYH